MNVIVIGQDKKKLKKQKRCKLVTWKTTAKYTFTIKEMPAMKDLVCHAISINLIFMLLCSPFTGDAVVPSSKTPEQKILKKLEKWTSPFSEWKHTGRFSPDSVSVHADSKRLEVFFTPALSHIPVREEHLLRLRQSVRDLLQRKYRDYAVEMYAGSRRVEELVPNYFREVLPGDSSRRVTGVTATRIPLVRQAGERPPEAGLYNNNIALWSSHGWYYESKLDRWEWQRARLFGTVEDIYTKGYVMPFLVPMLENSGATVLLPVERDFQLREVIMDNDMSTDGGKLLLPQGREFRAVQKGFMVADTLFPGQNPFEAGTSLLYEATPGSSDEVLFSASPEPGEYAVYLSWQRFPESCREVRVTVRYSGGRDTLLVNQRIGGGTWTYLGSYHFGHTDGSASAVDGSGSPTGDGSGTIDADDPGSLSSPASGVVSVSLSGKHGEVISVDAVRFGGGMGNVARRPADAVIPNQKSVTDGSAPSEEAATLDPAQFSWKTSGKSRYREGARYYLQYAGFPDTLVYSLNEGKNDYNDDYMSRGEWVNYLVGSPAGPTKNRNAEGLGIPVDLAFAFHTDAGITPGDSVIGTLGIYSTWADEGVFPDGSSRMTSRDLTDLIQTQIVEDIRTLYRPDWTRRALWDRQYSEAWRPNVPVMLLELLSHQNLADMRYGLDPRFRFNVSRAIYKGMLRFQAFREGRPYVVQPLPVSHFAILQKEKGMLELSWEPVTDPLEPTAIPGWYKVYLRSGDTGWNQGVTVIKPSLTIPLPAGDAPFDFKVTALNGGGESFPGEILSAGFVENSKGTVLIVNAFDRVCGPAIFDSPERAGIEWWHDRGVPWLRETTFIGDQYDFNRKKPWTDDDNPGWGSSFTDMEDLLIPGNSFDFSRIHGRAFNQAGYSYVSVSDEMFVREDFDASGYAAVDILLGEEKSTPSLKDPSVADFTIYTPGFMRKIGEIAEAGGNILMSGAYPGTELMETGDSLALRFAAEKLHFKPRTGHASRTGDFYPTDYGKAWFSLRGKFTTGYSPKIYGVESPDGIEPAGKEAFTAFRYGDNHISAGVAWKGPYRTLVMGFPLETIGDEGTRTALVKQIMDFFWTK